MNSENILGTISTNMPIKNVAVSESGIVASVQEDGSTTWIYVYDTKGNVALWGSFGYELDPNKFTDEEKRIACRLAKEAGADYVKTSTGFSTAGATFHDVELFAKHVGSDVKIKAAGGISSLEDAEKFIALGASRLGTSRIVKVAKALEAGTTAKNDGTY